jgi:hypothetical protein
MCPVIDNPASCEIRAVIHFHHAKNMSAVKIHCELCPAVYGQNVRREVECSKVGEQMFMLKNEVIDYL